MEADFASASVFLKGCEKNECIRQKGRAYVCALCSCMHRYALFHKREDCRNRYFRGFFRYIGDCRHKVEKESRRGDFCRFVHCCASARTSVRDSAREKGYFGEKI